MSKQDKKSAPTIQVPSIRFKQDDGSDFPDWEERRLGEVADIIGGGTPDTSNKKFWEKGNITWFIPSEIKQKYIQNSMRKITEEGVKASSVTILPAGTLLLTTRATIGDVGIATRECTTNQGFQNLIIKKGYDNEFIYYWILNNRNTFIKLASGSTFLEISKKSIQNITITLPSLPEQQKIASFLESVDTKVQLLEKKVVLLQSYKKGVMQKLFSQELRFKDEQGHEYPDWEEREIGEIFYVTRGLVLSKKDISPIKTRYYTYPVFSSQTKNKGLMGYYNKYLFESCITWTTDGYAGNVNYREGKFYCTNVCGVLKNDEGYANACIAEILNRITKRFVAYAGIPKLMNDVMSSIRIKIPASIKEQQKISSFLQSLDTKISLTQKQVDITKLYKKGLLQRMFV